LKELLVYPLTPVPYSIATPDGFLNKADKSKGDHFLNKDVEDVTPPPDDKTLVTEDDNAAFCYLKDLPPNFYITIFLYINQFLLKIAKSSETVITFLPNSLGVKLSVLQTRQRS
jgi:hypothetical protein